MGYGLDTGLGLEMGCSLDTGCGLETVTLETLAARRGWRGRFRMGKSASNPQPISNPQPVSKPVIASAANHSVVKRTRYRQYFCYSRNIGQVTPKSSNFYCIQKLVFGSKYPENVLFNFENRSTGYRTGHR